MRQITASEAKAYMRDVEARLKTIYNLAHLPEKTRRQILTLASWRIGRVLPLSGYAWVGLLACLAAWLDLFSIGLFRCRQYGCRNDVRTGIPEVSPCPL
mgnify:CR=1 FL=1